MSFGFTITRQRNLALAIVALSFALTAWSQPVGATPSAGDSSPAEKTIQLEKRARILTPGASSDSIPGRHELAINLVRIALQKRAAGAHEEADAAARRALALLRKLEAEIPRGDPRRAGLVEQQAFLLADFFDHPDESAAKLRQIAPEAAERTLARERLLKMEARSQEKPSETQPARPAITP